MSNAFSPSADDLVRLVVDVCKDDHQKLRQETLWADVDPDEPIEGAPWRWDSLEVLAIAGRFADRWGLRVAGEEERLLHKRTPRAWAQVVANVWTSLDPVVEFSSSGTTGTPTTGHTLSTLVDEMLVFSRLIPRPDRLLATVPAHHIYGFLFTVVLPALWRVPVTGPLSATRDGDLVCSHPWLFGQARQRKLSWPAVPVVSSAGALTREDWAWLEGHAVWEVFGSTETAGLGYRQSGDEPFTWLPGWTWDGGAQVVKAGRAYPLPDLFDRVSETTFRPTGRRDRAVKIAGHLVSLDRVKGVLEQCPAVREAVLRTDEDDRLRGFVVLNEGGTLDEVWQWVSNHLAAAERPHVLRHGPDLPVKRPGERPAW